MARLTSSATGSTCARLLVALFVMAFGVAVLPAAVSSGAPGLGGSPTTDPGVRGSTYDVSANRVHWTHHNTDDDRVASPTASRTKVTDAARPVIFPAYRIATKTGGGVVRHYTTEAAANAISKSGTLRPGALSGKTWLTADKYDSGAGARSALALDKTPDGYFEIPICRVRCPSGSSTVKPANGQLGGAARSRPSSPSM